MQVALKPGSPEKQKKTIENFLRRQEAHQKRKESNIRIKRIERDRSVSGRPKKDRSKSRRKSKSPTIKLEKIDQNPIELTLNQKKKQARVNKLNAYIQQLREDSDYETADEYEQQLNFHLN